MRLVRIRCFEDTGDIDFSDDFNIFIGKNNSGKSSLLKGILTLQGFNLEGNDIRPSHYTLPSFVTVVIDNIEQTDQLGIGRNPSVSFLRVLVHLRGQTSETFAPIATQIDFRSQIFANNRPHHTIIPFLARRKAANFSHDVSLAGQSAVTGTLAALYGRIDSLATYGHPDHEKFREAVQRIVGIPITMKASSQGKEARFYFDHSNFVTLERMGDGVSEMVALIVEL